MTPTPVPIVQTPSPAERFIDPETMTVPNTPDDAWTKKQNLVNGDGVPVFGNGRVKETRKEKKRWFEGVLPENSLFHRLASGPDRSHQTSRATSQHVASFAGVMSSHQLSDFVTEAELKTLQKLQKQTASIIDWIHTHGDQQIRAKYGEALDSAARGELSVAEIEKIHGSLNAALDEARRRRSGATLSLEQIIEKQLRPLLVAIGRRVEKVWTEAAEATIQQLVKLWQTHNVPLSQTELEPTC